MRVSLQNVCPHIVSEYRCKLYICIAHINHVFRVFCVDSCMYVSFCFQKMTIMVIHIDKKNMNYSSKNLLHTFAETLGFKWKIWLTGVGGRRRPVLAEGYCSFSLEEYLTFKVMREEVWGSSFTIETYKHC